MPSSLVSPGAGNLQSATARIPVVMAGPPSAWSFSQAMSFPGTWIKDPPSGKLVRYNPVSGNYQVFNPATGRIRLIAATNGGLSAEAWLAIAGATAVVLYIVFEKHGKK
jgi:hypothetical protein